jgi:drug/metabolite transporter (DMT)-like permease
LEVSFDCCVEYRSTETPRNGVAAMRKLAVAAMTMAVSTLLFAAPAFADSAVVAPVRDEIVKGEIVRAEVVVPPSELVFTGANITLWMVLVAALVIGGVALLIVGHRRQAGAAEEPNRSR